MSTKQYLRKMHEWIDLLESKSPVILSMNLKAKIKDDGDLDKLAFNFANSDEHNVLIIRGLERLVSRNAATLESAKDLVANIIKRNTYGAFSELTAYEWVMSQGVNISTQVNLTPNEVLGTEEVPVDGKMERFGEIYFEVKGFGFNGYMAARLKDLLEKKMPGMQVFVDESLDLSYEDFEKCFEDVNAIVSDLQGKGHTRRGPMNISAGPPKPISVSMIEHDPYALARKNAVFPFRSANQFTRNKPFVLIYVIHPWLGNHWMSGDFALGTTTFTRAFARRAFMQFANDTTLASNHCSQISDNTTLAEASKLLSAIIFVNMWPSGDYKSGTSESNPKPSWIYLNPRATHKLNHGQMRIFQNNHSVVVDDFSDDDY